MSDETVKMVFTVECDIPVELARKATSLIEREIEKGIETSGIYAVARFVPTIVIEEVAYPRSGSRFQVGDEIMWDGITYGPGQRSIIRDVDGDLVQVDRPVWGAQFRASLWLDTTREQLNIRKI